MQSTCTLVLASRNETVVRLHEVKALIRARNRRSSDWFFLRFLPYENYSFFFFQAEDGIRDDLVTGVQTCALPISRDGDDLAARASGVGQAGGADRSWASRSSNPAKLRRQKHPDLAHRARAGAPRHEIGRASCRERV